MCNCGTSFIQKNDKSVSNNTSNKQTSKVSNPIIADLKECRITYNDLQELSLIVISILKEKRTAIVTEINKQLRRWTRSDKCPDVNNFNALYNFLKSEHPEYFK